MNIPARFAALPFQEKRLVALSVVLLIFFRIAVRFFSLKSLLTLTAKLSRRPATGESAAPPSPDPVMWAVSAVARHVRFLDNCLVTALAARTLLGMESCPSTLRIGVTKGEVGTLSAHAWLELEGGILFNSGGDNSYTPLPRFDGEGR
jgi:hypothetical protein